MKFLAYGIAILTDVLQFALFLVFWALEPVTAVSGPIGTGLDMVISLVFGGVLMLVLAADGAFYPGMAMAAFVGEEIPILDAIIPFWTILVWRSQSKKHAKEKKMQAQEQEVVVQTPARPFEDIKHAQAA